MNKAKGIAILAALAALLAIVVGTAFKTGAVGGSDSDKLTNEKVGQLVVTELNEGFTKNGIQATVSSVGCQAQKKANKAAGLKKGDYFCLVGIQTGQGDVCYALTFTPVGNELPPIEKMSATQLALSYCQP